MRVLALFITYYEVPDKIFDELAQRLQAADPDLNKSLQMIRQTQRSKLAQSPRSKKVKRVLPLIDERGKREYRAKKIES